MIRIIFSALMIIHGLIHMAGFVKEWNLSSVNNLTGKTLITITGVTAKVIGMFWLFTSLLLITTAILYLLHKEWYWIPGFLAVIISQVLITIYWQDAKFGTIANVLILAGLVIAAAASGFENISRSEVSAIVAKANMNPEVVDDKSTQHLPGVVKKWMNRSNVIGTLQAATVHLKQKGMMRSTPDGKWMPFIAEQYFTTAPPAFVWTAKIHASGLFDIAARDSYKNGQGNMIIKPLYIYTLADSKGKEIDQGTMLRYLAELSWFPQAALKNYIQWHHIDDYHAKATMHYGDITASGIFSFSNDGDVTGFEARRYGDFDGNYVMETWAVAVKDYRNFDGIRIGNKSEVTWKLKDGDFTWLKVEITDLTYK